MKFYLLSLPFVHGVGHQYPPDYENIIGQYNQGHVYFDDPIDGLFKLLISIPDKNSLDKLPENVLELTETEAKTLGDKYEPSVPVITNEAVVRNLEIKANLGMVLSAKELDALDPTKDEQGFGMSQSFSTKIDKAKLIEKA